MHANRIWALGYLVVVVGLVAAFYGQRQILVAQKEAKASTVQCVIEVVSQTVSSTEVRSDAATKRDEALLGSKKALRELIRLRVLEQVSDSPEVRQAASQYVTQTQQFIDASRELVVVRKLNPVPDPAQIEACK